MMPTVRGAARYPNVCKGDSSSTMARIVWQGGGSGRGRYCVVIPPMQRRDSARARGIAVHKGPMLLQGESCRHQEQGASIPGEELAESRASAGGMVRLAGCCWL